MRIALVGAVRGLAAAAAVSVSPMLLASDQRPSERAADAATAEHIEALVRDLGAEQFAVRERASRELVQLGIVTRDALLRAAATPDAEVRARAREILQTVSQTDFEERLEAFSADYDGRHQHTLPAWDQFSAQLGASRFSRELFVEMQRAEPELLKALAAGPQEASAALGRRSQQLFDGHTDASFSLGTAATFLFVATAEDVKITEHWAEQLLPYVVQLTYQRYNKSPLWPPLLKKLVGRWLAKDTSPTMAFTNLLLASQLELKPESLIVAGRILSSDVMQANARQFALMVVGRYGDRSHVPLVEKALGDSARCELGGQPTPTPGKPATELQIRDLALAVLVQLTEQDLREYGAGSPQSYGPAGFPMRALSFPDDAARQTALKKWAAWRAAHPDS